jgi:nicotinamidase-related amidase
MAPSDRLRALVEPAQTAVLTMELQEGVVGRYATLPDLANVVAAEGILPRVGRLCAAAREAGARVVHCTAEFRSDGAGSVVNNRIFAVNEKRRREVGSTPIDVGQPGTALMPELGWSERDIKVPRMHGMTPFTGTELDAVLRNLGVRTVVAAGVSVNLGVLGMVLSALDLGYQIVLPVDAVVGVPMDYARAVIDNSLGLVSTLTTVDDLVGAWQ